MKKYTKEQIEKAADELKETLEMECGQGEGEQRYLIDDVITDIISILESK